MTALIAAGAAPETSAEFFHWKTDLGEVFARGSLETILQDEKVAEIYLGTTHAH